ncbi:MAG TPA: LD-carboxypeptidase [Gemmatimonadaceae bacterium]|nr:LD-carboxypeptidase [Gemmatimonadaceae bacterium]
MRLPPPLSPGARVALVAPSGPLRDEQDLAHALEATRRMDWEPVVGEHVRERAGYLAGSDAHRLADLDRFARDASVDGIWCIRGGYGATRLLDAIDYDAWRRHPKTLIGYSDITALHAAIGRLAGLVTFHGPTARGATHESSVRSLREAVGERTPAYACTARTATTLRAGRARGRLVGGNLAVLTALVGTPYAPDFDGAILMLEDVNESVYRIDRMLTQLRLAGALDRLAGLVFGAFTEIPDDASNEDRPLDDLLAEFADRTGVPCLANFPMGHIDAQWTIPLGAAAELDADKRTIVVELE